MRTQRSTQVENEAPEQKTPAQIEAERQARWADLLRQNEPPQPQPFTLAPPGLSRPRR